VGEPRSAAELAVDVVDRLPRHSAISLVSSVRLPMLSDRDSENECCPACARRLPFSFAQLSGGGMGGTAVINLSRSEYVHACLVDGPRARAALAFTASEIIDATRFIGEGLGQAHWRRWSRLFARATEDWLADERDRIEAAGQALEGLRLYGPFGVLNVDGGTPSNVADMAHSWKIARDDLEILISSSGPHWRARAVTPW
jgi:hypothetical protein